MQRKSKSNFVSRGLPWDKELWRRFLICKCKFILILLLLRILGPAGAFHVSTINYTRPGRSIWKCIFANTWEMQFREWTIRQYLAKLLTDDVGHLLLRPPAACSSWLVPIWRWWSCLHFFIVLTLLYCTLTTRDYYDSHNKRYNRKIIFCILLTSHHCCKFSVLKCLHVGEWVASCTWTAAEPQTINLFRFFSAQRRWRPLQKLHQLVRDAILQVDGGSRKAVTQLTNNNQKPARDTHIQLHCYNSIPLVHGISLLRPFGGASSFLLAPFRYLFLWLTLNRGLVFLSGIWWLCPTTVRICVYVACKAIISRTDILLITPSASILISSSSVGGGGTGPFCWAMDHIPHIVSVGNSFPILPLSCPLIDVIHWRIYGPANQRSLVQWKLQSNRQVWQWQRGIRFRPPAMSCQSKKY